MDSFESLLTFEPYSLNHIDKDRILKKHYLTTSVIIIKTAPPIKNFVIKEVGVYLPMKTSN